MVSSWLLLVLVSPALAFSHEAAASLSKDASSLLAFKTSISFYPSHLLCSWNPSTTYCLWYGVHCDPVSGRVTSLIIPRKMSSPKPSQLDANNFTASDYVLVGSLPTSIGNLTKLRTLSIPHHLLSGEIPAAIKDLALCKSWNSKKSDYPAGFRVFFSSPPPPSSSLFTFSSCVLYEPTSFSEVVPPAVAAVLVPSPLPLLLLFAGESGYSLVSESERSHISKT
ncbi:hypothetical protein RJ640_021515 [Escallonia rubra]|uniref:Leucine-rich repeat-containing N-terminal plant-type domain-containing protein n=1 Tax=Escallonia rubra TaxID=112253 RepID=A0AA88QQU5_9ASTE|nr:hypothetical protein RJ640_021515 [Escallonia rubra]